MSFIKKGFLFGCLNQYYNLLGDTVFKHFDNILQSPSLYIYLREMQIAILPILHNMHLIMTYYIIIYITWKLVGLSKTSSHQKKLDLRKELNVSVYQGLVLFLFNNSAKLTYNSIAESTAIGTWFSVESAFNSTWFWVK